MPDNNQTPQQVGSLSELDNPTPAIVGGDGATVLPDIKEEGAKQQNTPPANDPPPDEKPKDGDEIPDDDADKDKDTPDPDDNPDPGDGGETDEFFQEVDKLYGEDINSQIDFEGIDPTTPEGVFKREQYLMDRARREMDDFIRETDPRGYAYLLHRKNGGTDEEFMQQNPNFGLPALEQLQENVDLQKSIYTRALKERGNSDRQVQTLVEAAIKGGVLQEEAEEAYKFLEELETSYMKSLDDQTKASQQRFLDDVENFNSYLTETVKAMSLKIPDARQKDFLDNFSGRVKYEQGRFYLVEELDPKTLARILDREYFGYVNGDLSKLVDKRADTKNTQRLKLKVDKSQKQIPPQHDDNGGNGFVPLGSL